MLNYPRFVPKAEPPIFLLSAVLDERSWSSSWHLSLPNLSAKVSSDDSPYLFPASFPCFVCPGSTRLLVPETSRLPLLQKVFSGFVNPPFPDQVLKKTQYRFSPRQLSHYFPESNLQPSSSPLAPVTLNMVPLFPVFGGFFFWCSALSPLLEVRVRSSRIIAFFLCFPPSAIT